MTNYEFSSANITAALFNSPQAGAVLAKYGFTPAFEVAMLRQQEGLNSAVSATAIQNGIVSDKNNGLV